MPEMEKLEKLMTSLKEEKAHEMHNSEQLKNEKATLEGQLNELDVKEKQEMAGKQQTIGQLNKEINDMNEILNKEMHDSEEFLKPLKAQFLELSKKLPSLESEAQKNITESNNMMVSANKEIKQLRRSLVDLQKEDNEVSKRILFAQARFNKTSTYFNPLLKNHNKILAENEALNKKHWELQHKLFEITGQAEKEQEQHEAAEVERWNKKVQKLMQ